MITGELRNKIDRIWETFWTGGITNPLDVIEQFTYLLFIKLLLTKQIAEQENVTEQPKADNAMLWVQKMNEIQSRVREIIYSEIIYS